MSTATLTAPPPTQARTFVPWSVEDSVSPLDSDLLPVLTPDHFPRIAADPEWQQAERVLCETDPWYFRVNYVVTMDEHWAGKGYLSPYRRFPPFVHLRSYCYVLWKHRITAWPKSRQRMATWLVATQMLGDAMFTGGRLYMIQSKREADAKKVLSRVRGVYVRLRDMAPWLVPELVKDDAGELGWSNDSTFMAVPQGANYVQSHTPAWWLADEVQLQEEAQAAYEAALPACERITLVGTAEYGWFYQTLLADK